MRHGAKCILDCFSKHGKIVAAGISVIAGAIVPVIRLLVTDTAGEMPLGTDTALTSPWSCDVLLLLLHATT